MPDYDHKVLTRLATSLGYPTDDEQICHGFVMSAIQAFLGGEKTYAEFIKRLFFIINYDDDFNKLAKVINEIREKLKKHEKIDDTERDLLEISAFVETMTLYQLSRNYNDIFDRFLSQAHAIKASPYIQSEVLEKECQGLFKSGSFTGIYTEDKLKTLTALLEKHARAMQIDFVVTLEDDHHTILIAYRAATKTWDMQDINSLKLSLTRTFSDAHLATAIALLLDSSPDKDQEKLGIISKMMVRGHDQADGLRLANRLKCDPEFIKLHHLDENTATEKSDTGLTRLHLIAQSGNLDELNELSKLKNLDGSLIVDFNKTNIRKENAAYIASQNSHVSILTMLKKISDENPHAVNFKQTANNGTTPLHIAALHDDDQVVRTLCEMKTPHAVNQPTPLGWTPAHAAAHRGGFKTIRVLDEFKADFNAVTEQGFTPLQLAKQNQHTQVRDYLWLKALPALPKLPELPPLPAFLSALKS